MTVWEMFQKCNKFSLFAWGFEPHNALDGEIWVIMLFSSTFASSLRKFIWSIDYSLFQIRNSFVNTKYKCSKEDYKIALSIYEYNI